MAGESDVMLTIDFNNPELDAEETDAVVQTLMAQMRELDEVEAVDRVLNPNSPAGNKAVGASLVGLLK